ncbi:MAG: hypothetical protein Q8Q09_03600 [Deltaproteobacteria bacterium]|nr:hypothetical protein [Deltaproteobacteria bacterium]
MLQTKRFPVLFLATVTLGALLFPAQAFASGASSGMGVGLALMALPVVLVLAGLQALVGKFAQAPGLRVATAVISALIAALMGLGQIYLIWTAYTGSRDDDEPLGIGMLLGAAVLVLATVALSLWMGRRLLR